MTLKNSHWNQWDIQTQKMRELSAYIELNNLYLAIERGSSKLTITNANRLRVLVGMLDESKPADSFESQTQETINKYWETEFQKLPGWNDV